jgi:hypothetical protein
MHVKKKFTVPTLNYATMSLLKCSTRVELRWSDKQRISLSAPGILWTWSASEFYRFWPNLISIRKFTLPQNGLIWHIILTWGPHIWSTQYCTCTAWQKFNKYFPNPNQTISCHALTRCSAKYFLHLSERKKHKGRIPLKFYKMAPVPVVLGVFLFE